MRRTRWSSLFWFLPPSKIRLHRARGRLSLSVRSLVILTHVHVFVSAKACVVEFSRQRNIVFEQAKSPDLRFFSSLSSLYVRPCFFFLDINMLVCPCVLLYKKYRVRQIDRNLRRRDNALCGLHFSSLLSLLARSMPLEG